MLPNLMQENKQKSEFSSFIVGKEIKRVEELDNKRTHLRQAKKNKQELNKSRK